LLLKKSIWLEGIRDKTITDDGAKRAFSFLKDEKHALALTALHGFFQTKSISPDLLFAYSSIK
jgi:hypothetical protein